MAARKPNLGVAYTALALACGIAEGDKVRILRPFKSSEMGCTDDWDDDMELCVGKEGTVTGIYGGGFEVDDNWCWPFFCLQKIADPLCVRAVTEDDEYAADIRADGTSAEIGCQTVRFEKVEELYNAMKAAQAAFKPPVVRKTTRRTSSRGFL